MTFDISLQQILLRIVAFLVISAVHGFALVGLLTAFGDRGPRFDGRLSLSPLAHLDPMGAITAICTLGGWIRPLQLDPAELRQGRVSLALSVVGALLAVVVVGLILLQLRSLAVAVLPPSASNLINAWLILLAQMSLVFAIMNLIPLPPFAGGYLLQAAAPRLFALVQPRTTIIAVVLMVLALIDRGALVRQLLGPMINAIGA